MTLTVGNLVITTEHPNSIGEVIRMNESGDATIQFTTPPRENLPFGHIGTEFWPVADQNLLIPFFEVASIMGAVKKALKRNGQADQVEEYLTKAMSGDYDNLLRVSMEYVDFE